MDDTYSQCIREKKRFIILSLIFTFIFYFMLPVTLTFFPGAMNQTSFILGLSWAWLYAVAQIVMVWVLGWIYHQKAKKWERMLEQR